jgi:hypothetical protein
MLAIAPPMRLPVAAPIGLPRPIHQLEQMRHLPNVVNTLVRAGSCLILTPIIPKPAGITIDIPSPEQALNIHIAIRFYISSSDISTYFDSSCEDSKNDVDNQAEKVHSSSSENITQTSRKE